MGDPVVEYLAREALEKRAELGSVLLGAGSLGSAIAASLGARISAKARREGTISEQKGLKSTSEDRIHQMKVTAGLPYIPHKIIPHYANAMYIRPESLTRDDKHRIENVREKARREGRFDILQGLEAISEIGSSPTGGIIIGDKVKNDYTVAHELGHALIDNESSLRKFLAKTPDALADIFKYGALAGLGVGAVKPNWIPGIAAGVAGIGALNVGAQYLDEYEANKEARNIVKKTFGQVSPKGERTLAKGQSTYGLPRALSTVVAAPLAVAGGAYLASSALDWMKNRYA